MAFFFLVVVLWNYDHSCCVMCLGKEYASTLVMLQTSSLSESQCILPSNSYLFLSAVPCSVVDLYQECCDWGGQFEQCHDEHAGSWQWGAALGRSCGTAIVLLLSMTVTTSQHPSSCLVEMAVSELELVFWSALLYFPACRLADTSLHCSWIVVFTYYTCILWRAFSEAHKYDINNKTWATYGDRHSVNNALALERRTLVGTHCISQLVTL